VSAQLHPISALPDLLVRRARDNCDEQDGTETLEDEPDRAHGSAA